ncbi:TetR/AcrR family transcriptional regulator [Rhodococcus koreensis]
MTEPQARDGGSGTGRVWVGELADLVADLAALSFSDAEVRGDTRERLLTAAIGLFAVHGFEACTVKHIAQAAGIKPPGLYAHFSSKEAVLSAAMARALSSFLSAVLAPEDPDDPLARLECVVKRHVIFQLCHSSTATANDLLLNSDVMDRLGAHENDVLIRGQRVYHEHVRDLIRQCVPAAAAAGTTVSTMALITVCDSVTSWYRPNRALTPEEIAEEYWLYARGMLQLC